MDAKEENTINAPQVVTTSIKIPINDNEETEIILHSQKYLNGVFVSIYENDPKLGSISVGYPLGESFERYQLFSGKHSDLADGLSLLLAKRLNTMVYGSVIVGNDTPLNHTVMKELINQYLAIIS